MGVFNKVINVFQSKERKNAVIFKQHHDADNESLGGKTTNTRAFCVENMSKLPQNAQEVVVSEIIGYYGENMPVNTAFRLKLGFDKNPVWSETPGCFEQTLRLRDGSLLFPFDRRIVCINDIHEAQEKDKLNFKLFNLKYGNFIEDFKIKTNNAEFMNIATDVLQEVQSLIEEIYFIGGNFSREHNALNDIEQNIISLLSENNPDGAELLQQAKSLSFIKRLPSICRANIISENDALPTLLASDLNEISTVGYASRNFLDFKPNGDDVKKHLDISIKRGFSEKRANAIWNAWISSD